ncbi:hypothetical protein MCOR25_009283 [Pyricularia grisea]|nr:hypothetical protein MCOR25_009283 [Pyricularia grisea]
MPDYAYKLSIAFKNWATSPEPRRNGVVIDRHLGDTPRPFIPVIELQRWWTKERIDCFRKALRLEKDMLSGQYLVITSILILMGDRFCTHLKKRLEYFYRFRAGELTFPLSKDVVNCIFPDNEREDGESFHREQLLFSPVGIETGLWDQQLGSDLTLHLKFISVLRDVGNHSPTISKYARYDGSKPSDNDFLVIKIFPPGPPTATFEDEARLYRKLRLKSQRGKKPSDFFLLCHGIFEQNNHRGIILEYATGGSLLDYFNNNPEPLNNAHDRYQFYAALLDIPMAIRALSIMGYVHQDIKPGNIFVFCDDPRFGSVPKADGTRKIRLKLGDYGLSSRLIFNEGSQPHSRDRGGDLTYSAPELLVQEEEFRDFKMKFTVAAEVWAVGCVMLDSIIWAVRGNASRVGFADKRKNEIQTLHLVLAKRGYTYVFHDGEKILKAVRKVEYKILRGMCNCDKWTKGLVGTVLEKVLLPQPEARLAIEDIAKELRAVLDSWKPPPPDEGPSSPKHHSPNTSAMATTLPVNATDLDVQNDEAVAVGDVPPVHPATTHNSQLPCKHPGVKANDLDTFHSTGKKHDPGNKISRFLRDVEETFESHNHVLVIDDSAGMWEMKSDVRKVVRAITYAVKNAANGSIKVYFTSNPTKHHQVTNVKGVKENITSDDDRKSFLSSLFESSTSRRVRTSILVLTDGIWGDRNRDRGLCDVDERIRDFVDGLPEISKACKFVYAAIQFISFGKSDVGQERLSFLKDQLGLRVDMVDTKSHEDPLWSILVGAFDRAGDAEPVAWKASDWTSLL